MNILGFFQRLGRALQLPIAVLPVAALLLRFGQPDLLNVAFIAQAGGAIFDNLALIFAIGVASSWSKDSAGAAALAGAVGYFVLTKAMVTINPEINMGVLAGIITGLVGGAAYNRWSDIKLPDFLSFFGGKRFVPIATGFFCLVLAAIFGYVQTMKGKYVPRKAGWDTHGLDRFCGRAGFRYLWFHQPSADPNRSASGAEHHRLVPDW